MRAMIFHGTGQPLQLEDVPCPQPAVGQLLVRVGACGICRTDLHVIDGDLKAPALPLIPGHQIVGEITGIGEGVAGFGLGQRVGIPWLGGSCGHCWFCEHQRENLCDKARYTGYQINGGFAEYTVADARYCFPIPEHYSDELAAPLLCAGLIGYRSYRLVKDCGSIALYGFGAAAHILIQVARYRGQRIVAFTRPGDTDAQNFALELGADWAGNSGDEPPGHIDGAIIFAPAGELVPEALRRVRKGGRVVCAGIHMSDIPQFPYEVLWGERELMSVANLTRRDGEEFLPLAAEIPIETTVHRYALQQANAALEDLRHGRFTGAAVLVP